VTSRLVDGWLRARLSARTIRFRLTAIYGSLFLASGAALLTITYLLVARSYGGDFFVVSTQRGEVTGGGGGVIYTGPGLPAPDPRQVVAQAHAQSTAALHQLLIQSGIALAIMAVLSIGLGWLVAGRALSPLRTIADAARDISANDLHRRLALDGPDDELKHLGNTFDGLLGRLEASFAAQRQFVANASHELRTPLTYERALLEVALADPEATVETFRETCRQLLVSSEQQERLIEALLTLSRSQRGLDRNEPVDLRELAAKSAAAVRGNGLRVDTMLGPARTNGDPRLVERLVANLVSNAARHNVPNGSIAVTTGTQDGRAVLNVANTGPVIPPGEVERLFRPFQRLAPDRTGADGTGLGLSIVEAVAAAHGAEIEAEAQAAGGLRIEVAFPAG
jgi:signal transduction histidine kinase